MIQKNKDKTPNEYAVQAECLVSFPSIKTGEAYQAPLRHKTRRTNPIKEIKDETRVKRKVRHLEFLTELREAEWLDAVFPVPLNLRGVAAAPSARRGGP